MPLVKIKDREAALTDKEMVASRIADRLMTKKEAEQLQYADTAWWNTDNHQLVVDKKRMR